MLFLAGECGRGGGVWWAWRWCWRLWLGVVAGAAVTAATVVHGAVALWGGGGWKLAEFGWRRLCGTGRFPAWGHADGGGGGSGCCLAGVDPLSPACRRGGGSRWWRWRRRALFDGGAVGPQVRGSGGVAGGMLRGGFVRRVICVGGMFCVGSGGGRCTGVGAVFFLLFRGAVIDALPKISDGPGIAQCLVVLEVGGERVGRSVGTHAASRLPPLSHPRSQEDRSLFVLVSLAPRPLAASSRQTVGLPTTFLFPLPSAAHHHPPLISPTRVGHLVLTLALPPQAAPESAPLPPPPPPDAPSLPTIETRCDGWQIDDGSTK